MSSIPPQRGGRRQTGTHGFAVVDGFAGRRSVIPFAILVMAILGAGMVLLLVLNTALDQGAFSLQSAQQRNSTLTDQQQALQLRLYALSGPSALASEAGALGMVPDPRPVFLDPGTGAVLGVPTRATAPPPSPSPTPTPSATPTSTASPTATPGGTASPGAGSTASPAANTVSKPAAGDVSATPASAAKAPTAGATTSTKAADAVSATPREKTRSTTAPAAKTAARPAPSATPQPAAASPGATR